MTAEPLYRHFAKTDCYYNCTVKYITNTAKTFSVPTRH